MKPRSLPVTAAFVSLWIPAIESPCFGLDGQSIPTKLPAMKVKIPPSRFLAPSDLIGLDLYEQKTKIHMIRFGFVECAPESAVYIINTASNPVVTAVFVLDEKQKGDVKIKLGDKVFTASTGEEILLSETPDLSFAKLNPKLTIPYRNVKLVDTVGNIRVFKAEFQLAASILRIPRIAALAKSSNPLDQIQFRKLLKTAFMVQPETVGHFESNRHIASIHEASEAKPESKPETSSQNMLIGAVEDIDIHTLKGKVIDLTIDSAYSEIDQDVRLLKELTSDKTLAACGWISADSRDTDLLRNSQVASALVLCSDDCFIKTELAVIKCKSGSKLFIDNHGGLLTICTLDSKGAHDVCVKASDLPAFALMPGKAAALRKHGPASGLGPAHLITYRNWSDRVTARDTDVYGGEFSIMSALFAIEPLRLMIDSKDPKERAHAQNVIKAAIIWANLNPGAQYEPAY